MSGFSEINMFGNLTIKGQRLTFEDFDKNKDNKISIAEYNAVLKEMKLDKVELSTVDTNKDNIISKEEFVLWDQKIQMQDAVNQLAGNINIDFANKTEYIPTLQTALKDFMLEYIEKYKGSTQNLASSFEKVLPNKYEAIKSEILKNDYDTIAANVIYELTQEIRKKNSINENLLDGVLERTINLLNAKSSNFIKTYNGNNFQADLKRELQTFLNKSDAERMSSEKEEFQRKSFRITNNDENALKELKELTRTFLTAAINKGITVRLGGSNILTEAAINSVLTKYSSAQQLRNDMNEAISALSTENLVNKLATDEEQKLIDAENKKFTDIKGSEYAINPNAIDYSKIPGYFDNSTVSTKAKKSTEELKNNVKEQMIDIINKNLKAQMKKQIQTMLQEKGIPFEKIQQVFENVFNTSIIETLNAEGTISSNHKTWFKKGNAEINIKQCIDKFITTFNKNIETTVDKMNASNKDFDTADLDLTHLNVSTVNNDDIVKSYQTGIPLTTKKEGADYYVKVAEKIIDGLKPQMMTKAKAMCKANGVKFDEKVFTKLFNDIKDLAVDTAVTGVDKKGRNWAGTGAAAAGGAIAGFGAVAAATTTATIVVGTTLVEVVDMGALVVPLTTTAVVTGPVGWVIGGVLLAAGILASVLAFGGNKSQSCLDTRTLVDGFTETFAQSYTKWVEEEKAKTQGQ